MITEVDILQALRAYRDPYLGQDWVSAKAVRQVDLERKRIDVELSYPVDRLRASLSKAAESLLPKGFSVEIRWKVSSHAVQAGQTGIPTIKNIIAIGSGKGGVGKSTTSVNLALALSQEGARVGILDADIYGPNQPMMLGVSERPEIMPNKKIKPIVAHGLQSMSIAYLIDGESPMIWRGPMISQAVHQMLYDTLWEALDYLIIDLPPGTGDIPLTLAKKVPVVGAVIVSTPQSVSVLDAKKALETFNRLSISVLGVIENMAIHVCSQCQHEEAIFGENGGKQLAERYHVPFLGQLPLNAIIREHSDQGYPIVQAEPDGLVAQRYREMARHLSAQIALRPLNFALKFPKVVVEG